MKNQSQIGCALPADLRYYILRGDNVMVPMVPADQLPFQLPGVPRQLSHQQMSSECWKYLSEPGKLSSECAIQAPLALERSRFRAPDHQVRIDQDTADERVARPGKWYPSPTLLIEHTLAQRTSPEKVVSMADKFAEIYPLDAQRFGYHGSYPSGIERDASKKEYCTHWIKTGECAFTAIGCKYKHEMPDIVKLREIGFREVPRWWKDKTALAARGPTWIEQRRAALSNKKDMDISETPARREFDPSNFKAKSNTERSMPSDDIRQKRSLLRRETNYDKTVRSAQPSVAGSSMCSASPVQGLLIDFEDVPASPPSPQLSHISSESTASNSTKDSNHISPSPAPLDTIKSIPMSLAVKKTVNKDPIANPEKKRSSHVFSFRRGSEVSWTSISSEDGDSVGLICEQRKVEAAEPTKPYGLHRSKHATIARPGAQREYINKPKTHQVSHQQNKMVGAPKASIEIGKVKEMARHRRVRCWK